MPTTPSNLLLSLAAIVLTVAAWAPPSAAALSGETQRRILAAEDERRWDKDLQGLLADGDAAVRARAALAVGRLQDSTSVMALTRLLGDVDVQVKREAVFALGQVGHRSAREALEEKLSDGDGQVVQLAIEALGKLGDKASTKRLLPFLGNASPALRGEAAMAFWRLADSTALEPLVARHSDPDPEVRWRVLWALEKLIHPARVVLIAAHHLDDPSPLVRAYAARTLGRQKSPRAVAYLLQAFDDADVGVAVNAVRGLQLVADTTCARCAPALVALLSHPHPYLRATAATALGDRFSFVAADSGLRRRMLDSLAAHLADRDAATRAAVARALIQRGGEAGFARAQALLADSSIYVRTTLLGALAGLPKERIREVVLPRLAPSYPMFERMAAYEALGGLGREREVVDVLRKALADTTLVVAVSASTLAELGDSASVRDLVAAYRQHAAASDPDARNAIKDALRTLAGASFADSIERRLGPGPPRRAGAQELAAPPTARGALLRTSKGEIEWDFYAQEAPQTVKNFIRLAERKYFDGLAVHRVVPNFVIQDGDPTGTGWGGPGYTIRCEYNRLRYAPGMVGMALSGKDTGGSQWFITHSPQPHLDGRYTIFARVTRGMDVVGRIVQGDRVLAVELLK